MRYARQTCATLLLISLGSAATAEIYETRNAQGHPVFSDSPSAGSIRVDISRTNIADAVTVSEPAPSAKQVTNAGSPGGSTPAVTWQQRVLDEEDEKRRHRHELAGDDPHSEQRHEVGDEGDQRRHEVGDEEDERRHEVGDEDDVHRHEVGDHLVEHHHSGGREEHDHALDGFAGQGEVIQRHVNVGRAVHHR